MVLVLRRATQLFDQPSKVLHFAPEPAMQKLLQVVPGIDYTTGDLLRQDVDLPGLDVTDTGLPSDHFDALICSHVLEHVPDDAAALRELARILRPDGWALINVPVRRGTQETDEDLTVTDPRERLQRFGQDDHVRWYGRGDFLNRMDSAGWSVRDISDLLTDEDVVRFGLGGAEGDFAAICRVRTSG